MCTATGKIDSRLEDLEDGVYIIQKGIVTSVPRLNFGQDILSWRNGEVFDIERTEKLRVKQTK